MSRHRLLVLVVFSLELVPSRQDDVLEPGLIVEQFDPTNPGKVITVAIDKKVEFWMRPIQRVVSRWRGRLRIEQPGSYTFRIRAIGGSKLMFGSEVVVALGANGTSGLQDNRGIRACASGYHDITVEYREGLGEAGLILQYSGPDTLGTMMVVPPTALFHVQGPCDLTQVEHAAPFLGRQALDDGDTGYQVTQCEPGYHVLGASGTQVVTSVMLSCHRGTFTPSSSQVCGLLPCKAPVLPTTHGTSCVEGLVIANGQVCTPFCPMGLVAGYEGPLRCDNGKLGGEWFDCHQARSCNVDPLQIPHSASPNACLGGNSVKHGERCVPRCEDGFTPSVGMAQLTCVDGFFSSTSMAQGPAFQCALITTTTSTTTTTNTVTTTTTIPNAVVLAIAEVEHAAGHAAWFWWVLLTLGLLCCCVPCLICCWWFRRGSSKRTPRSTSRSISDSSGGDDDPEVQHDQGGGAQEKLISASWRPVVGQHRLRPNENIIAIAASGKALADSRATPPRAGGRGMASWMDVRALE